MKNILITVDGSEYSKRALEKGKVMAKAFGSKITLLHVRHSVIPYLALEEAEKYMHMIEEKSEKILNDSKEYFDDVGADVELISLEGDTASNIIKFINENDFDMVIMGSQGLNAGKVKGMLLGSITNKVIHHVDKPVLVVK